ncbi:MAG: hypothetical protein O3B24_01970 [Verrucomicrobia bacterium]|nr:hypothetical protein [Verrucomicrobiota bacterium]
MMESCRPVVIAVLILATLSGCMSARLDGVVTPLAPSAINVDVSIVRFDVSDVHALAEAGDEGLLKLLRSGRGVLLHAFHLAAQPGVEAHAEDATLLPYPALLKPTRRPGDAPNAPPLAVAPGVDARQIGADVAVLPTLEDGQIQVCIAANVVRVASWQTNQVQMVTATNTVALSAELPTFRKQSLDTCVQMADGASMVVGGPLSGDVDGDAVYVFLTARMATTLSETP